jgi:hypothetical protein
MSQLLFGQYDSNNQLVSQEREFRVERTEEEFQQLLTDALSNNPYVNLSNPELKTKCKERGLKSSGNSKEMMERLIKYDLLEKQLRLMNTKELTECCLTNEIKGVEKINSKEELMEAYIKNEVLLVKKGSIKKKPKKGETIGDSESDVSSSSVEAVSPPAISSYPPSLLTLSLPTDMIYESPKKYVDIMIPTIGMTPLEFTPSGAPQVSSAILKKLSGKNVFSTDPIASPPLWGEAYEFFGGNETGKKACQAIGALAMMGVVDTSISSKSIDYDLDFY